MASLHEDWSVPFDAATVDDEPIDSGGRVHVSSVSNTVGGGGSLDVHAFDAATGAPVWSTDVLTEPTSSQLVAYNPAIGAGSLWAGANTDLMVGHFPGCGSVQERLDPETGAVTAEELGRFGSTVVQAGSSLVQVTGDQLPATGCNPTSTPVVRDAATLATRWTAPLGGLSALLGNVGPTVAGDRVIVADRDLVSAFALDGCGAASCSPVWTLPLPAGALALGQPAAGPGDQLFLAVGHAFDEPQRTELVALSRSTGAVRWTAVVDDTFRFRMGIAVAGGRVPVSGGQVFDAAGCGAATCDPLVTVPVSGTPTGLSVSDGRAYLTNGSSLTAYAP